MAETFAEQDSIADTAADKLRIGAFSIWALLAVTTVLMAAPVWYFLALQKGLIGWKAYENAAFMTFHAFLMDDVYTDPDLIGDHIGLIVARWTGALTALWTVVIAAISVFNTTMIRLSAGVMRNHTLILGDHPIANTLAAVAARKGLKVLHISERVKEPAEEGTRITLPRPSNEMGLKLGRARTAARIIVAKSDLGASAELGLEATRLVSRKRKRPFVAIHLEDPTTAEHVHHLSEGDHAYAFSSLQASARDVAFRHPPFLLAKAAGADAVHALIVGFGHLGEALARVIILNTRTIDQGVPWITIVDPDPDAGTAFLARHPEIHMAARVRFMTKQAGEDLPDLYAPHNGQPAPRVCAVYVCIPDSALALNAAIAVKEQAQRHALFEGPIFVREANGGGLMRPSGGVACFTQALPLVGFGSLDAAVNMSRVLDGDPDAPARSAHEAYVAIYNRLYDGEAIADWDHLSEEFRVSNRRIINHIPAKLYSLGFDLEPWLAMEAHKRPALPTLAPNHPLIRDENDRLIAARLEHLRWLNDRYVNGWRYGQVRNNQRKIHPDLVSFEELNEDTQGFDFGVVDWLAKFIKTKKGGLKRLP